MLKFTLNNSTEIYEGVQLKQIVYLIDIPEKKIKVGDLGGYVEKEQNLSQFGTAVIKGHAKAVGNALVTNDATVEGHAVIKDRAIIMNSGHVSGRAIVMDEAKVENEAWIRDKATVKGSSAVKGSAEVYGEAILKGDSFIQDAHVYGEAKIIKSYVLSKGTKVMDAYVEGSSIDNGSEVNGKVEIRHSRISNIKVQNVVKIDFSNFSGTNILLKDETTFKNVTINESDNVTISGKASLEKTTFEGAINVIINGHARIQGIAGHADYVLFNTNEIYIEDNASIIGSVEFQLGVEMAEYAQVNAESATKRIVLDKDILFLSGDTLLSL